MTTPIRPDQVARAFAEKFPGTTAARDEEDGAIVVDVGLPEICGTTLEEWFVVFDASETMEHVREEVERMVTFVEGVCP